MRLFLFFSIICCLSQSWAFTYSETEAFDKPSAFELATLTQRMYQAGFYPLDQQGGGRIPLLNMDQVYSQNDKTVFLKMGMKISDPKEIGKIIPHPKGFIFHAVTAKQTPYAMFFYQMTLIEVEQALSKSGQLKIISSRTDLFSKFMAYYQMTNLEARAESASICLASAQAMRRAREQSTQIVGENIGGVLKSCAVSAVKGIVDGAKDLVQNSWYVIKTLFTNPEKLWNDVVEKYGEIKEFVTNFGAKMEEFFNTMKSLDPAIAAEIACSTISSVIVQALITGGIGGLVRSSVMVTTKIAALEKIKNALNAISKIEKTVPNSNRIKDLAKDVVACVK